MAESDPTPVLHDDVSHGASRRSATRDSLFLLTTISSENGQLLAKARVRNLSESGLMADCEARFRDGDRLVVHLRGIGEIAGQVSWVRGDRVGLTFDEPIDPRAARRPVRQDGNAADRLPPYLRQLPRMTKFPR